MSLTWLLIIVLIVALIAGAPQFGYHRYGYAPSGVLGVVLVIIVILILLGRL